MSFRQHCIHLEGDSPGQSIELNYYRIGPESPSRKVYLQAAIHADEQPGILVLHHLLSLLREADAAGLLDAGFVVFPMVNPIGMSNIEFLQHQGRYNRSTGVNFNRQWPDLFAAIDDSVVADLGNDVERNRSRVREALSHWVEKMPTGTAIEQWRQALYREACDADYVFDLHCDDDSLLHIFSVPQLAEEITSLSNWTGAAATMLAEDSGGGSFDEVWPALWLKLARDFPDLDIPMPVISCTLEYRGQMDTYDHLNRDDAVRLYAYFQMQGLIRGEPEIEAPGGAKPTDLRATDYMKAPASGLILYQTELGQRVAKGDLVAELLQLDGEGAFLHRTPVLASTDGLLLSRNINKYVWRNANIGKIVGTEIIKAEGEFLLSD